MFWEKKLKMLQWRLWNLNCGRGRRKRTCKNKKAISREWNEEKWIGERGCMWSYEMARCEDNGHRNPASSVDGGKTLIKTEMMFCKLCNWNDRRSRCMFLCFYSAIFQLTSAKFQTFAYNSRTVWSSYMKFGQQFEINDLYVCTKFRGNGSRDFGFRTRKPPRKFGVKTGLSQKRLKYGKNISYGCMS